MGRIIDKLLGRKATTINFEEQRELLKKTEIKLKSKEELILEIIQRHLKNIKDGKEKNYTPGIIASSMKMVSQKLNESNIETTTLDEIKRIYINSEDNMIKGEYIKNFLNSANEKIDVLKEKIDVLERKAA